MEDNIIWTDKKRWLFLGLPWTVTRYTLKKDKLLIDTGFFTTVTDEVRLYRISDLSLRRTLFQKMGKMGTIVVSSFDKTLGTFEIKNIKNPQVVKETLSSLVEEERTKKRVYARETMADDCEHEMNGERT